MTTNNLYAASSEWASRPADQRYWNLADLHAACVASREGSATAQVPFNSLRAQAQGSNLQLVGSTGAAANFTHYAFGQFANAVGAPAEYLRKLPTDVAAGCLNAGIDQTHDRSDRNLLFHKNGSLTLRACLTERYERVWNSDLVRALRDLDGWRNPAGRAPVGYEGPTRAAMAEDILPGQINIDVGQTIAPAGLYASDHDMFAFLVAPDRVIDDGSGKPLMRGVMVKNSEVGDSSLVFTFFMMQAVCGNHIIWGAQGVHEIRVRHVGGNPLRKALREFEGELRRYRDGAAEEEKGIIAARKMLLGSNKEEVLKTLVAYCKAHSLPLSRAKLSDAYDTAERFTDWYGDPKSLWANVAGLTHTSQGVHQDAREVTDRAAGQLMQMAF